MCLVSLSLSEGQPVSPSQASVTKATERGGTEVMGRLAGSPGLGKGLVIPGVVMATEELMGSALSPWKQGQFL